MKACIVAILKNEERFVDEWIVYHKLIGFDHFFIYDDDNNLPLLHLSMAYQVDVTIVPWAKIKQTRNSDLLNQIAAYRHAFDNFLKKFEWVAFIDGDEFIVTRSHDNIKSFILSFGNVNAISLHWHVFGHCGYYDDPPGLITQMLKRRMFEPSIRVKTISRVSDIIAIDSAHYCMLIGEGRVDALGKPFNDDLYPGKSDSAHINHYQCRSFLNWMERAKRGDVNFNEKNSPKQQAWRLTEQLLLKQFVTTVAFNKNEYVDDYMSMYEDALTDQLLSLKGA